MPCCPEECLSSSGELSGVESSCWCSSMFLPNFASPEFWHWHWGSSKAPSSCTWRSIHQAGAGDLQYIFTYVEKQRQDEKDLLWLLMTWLSAEIWNLHLLWFFWGTWSIQPSPILYTLRNVCRNKLFFQLQILYSFCSEFPRCFKWQLRLINEPRVG